VNEYLRLATSNRKAEGTEAQYRHILGSGIRTLTHVFKVLLLYTRNLELTWHHCQKAAYYYVEFMGQIGADPHGFLQLNAKDAALFVYKKTIFDMNNECRKEFGSMIGHDDRWDNINSLANIYSRCVEDVIEETPMPILEDGIAQVISEKTTGLSRALFNLALVGTESGYRERLVLVDWLERGTSGWGGIRVRVLEQFAKKLRTHRPTLTKLKDRWNGENAGADAAHRSVSRYVSWLLGRRSHAR
jgi:hypothetical protein